jgi:DNA replication initiation complex subunit (GINS family)
MKISPELKKTLVDELRLVMIERGDEKVIQIPDDFFNKLARLTEELAKTIEEDKDVYEILKKITIHSYLLSGNGYYLYQKGIIKV